MAQRNISSSFTAIQTTAGVAEETINLSQDGAAAAAMIAVPEGTLLNLKDFVFMGKAESDFRVQVADDGVNFTDRLLWQVPVKGTNGVSDMVALTIEGGPLIAFRLRGQTPGGASQVRASFRGVLDAEVS